MAERNQDKPDRIGKPDPENEPTPPGIDSAGALGEVGERKLEESHQKQAVEQGIWGNRPPTRDEDPEASAARTPGKPK
jgi:hypothetical protein